MKLEYCLILLNYYEGRCFSKGPGQPSRHPLQSGVWPCSDAHREIDRHVLQVGSGQGADYISQRTRRTPEEHRANWDNYISDRRQECLQAKASAGPQETSGSEVSKAIPRSTAKAVRLEKVPLS